MGNARKLTRVYIKRILIRYQCDVSQNDRGMHYKMLTKCRKLSRMQEPPSISRHTIKNSMDISNMFVDIAFYSFLVSFAFLNFLHTLEMLNNSAILRSQLMVFCLLMIWRQKEIVLSQETFNLRNIQTICLRIEFYNIFTTPGVYFAIIFSHYGI